MSSGSKRFGGERGEQGDSARIHRILAIHSTRMVNRPVSTVRGRIEWPGTFGAGSLTGQQWSGDRNARSLSESQ